MTPVPQPTAQAVIQMVLNDSTGNVLQLFIQFIPALISIFLIFFGLPLFFKKSKSLVFSGGLGSYNPSQYGSFTFTSAQGKKFFDSNDVSFTVKKDIPYYENGILKGSTFHLQSDDGRSILTSSQVGEPLFDELHQKPLSLSVEKEMHRPYT